MSFHRFRVCFLAASLMALAASAGRADGLLYELPKDGTWAEYDLDCTAKAGGAERTVTGTLRMASVGRATVQLPENTPQMPDAVDRKPHGGDAAVKQSCRWIEVELIVSTVVDGKEMKKDRICKLLVPDKWLVAGQSPLDHVVRTWWQPESGAPVVRLTDPRTIDTPLPVILSGPWKGVKPLKKTEIDCGLGKLSCEGVEGTLEFPQAYGGGMKCTLEDWLNPASPFGVVSSHWLLETRAGTLEWNLKLSKSGQGAESRLPESK